MTISSDLAAVVGKGPMPSIRGYVKGTLGLHQEAWSSRC